LITEVSSTTALLPYPLKELFRLGDAMDENVIWDCA
jgi:hypothetical protein